MCPNVAEICGKQRMSDVDCGGRDEKIVLLWFFWGVLGDGVSVWAQENAGDGAAVLSGENMLHFGRDSVI